MALTNRSIRRQTTHGVAVVTGCTLDPDGTEHPFFPHLETAWNARRDDEPHVAGPRIGRRVAASKHTRKEERRAERLDRLALNRARIAHDKAHGLPLPGQKAGVAS